MVWVNTSPLVKTYTLEEFWALPEPPDHSKLELIAGVLYMTPPPGYTHDNAVSRLIRLLSEHLIKSGNTGTLYVPRAAIWIICACAWIRSIAMRSSRTCRRMARVSATSGPMS